MSSHKKSESAGNSLGNLLGNINLEEIMKNIDLGQVTSLISSLGESVRGDNNNNKKVSGNIDDQKIKEAMSKLSSMNIRDLFDTESFAAAKEKMENVFNGDMNSEIKEKLKGIKSNDINDMLASLNEKLSGLKKGNDDK